MLSVTELVRAGLGVAALPDFLLGGDLQPLGRLLLAGHDTALWLLTRPDCRALRSVVTLFDELGSTCGCRGARFPQSAHAFRIESGSRYARVGAWSFPSGGCSAPAVQQLLGGPRPRPGARQIDTASASRCCASASDWALSRAAWRVWASRMAARRRADFWAERQVEQDEQVYVKVRAADERYTRKIAIAVRAEEGRRAKERAKASAFSARYRCRRSAPGDRGAGGNVDGRRGGFQHLHGVMVGSGHQR